MLLDQLLDFIALALCLACMLLNQQLAAVPRAGPANGSALWGGLQAQHAWMRPWLT